MPLSLNSDASTLGKIDIKGRDANEFLNRVYTNSWSKLGIIIFPEYSPDAQYPIWYLKISKIVMPRDFKYDAALRYSGDFPILDLLYCLFEYVLGKIRFGIFARLDI